MLPLQRVHVQGLGVVHGGPGPVGEARRPEGSPDPLPPAEVAALEHVFKRGIHDPEVALPVPAVVSGDLHEALVQTQVVSDAVLPAFFILLVVRELVDDVFVYPAQGLPLLAALIDRHRDESDVGVGGLVAVRVPGLVRPRLPLCRSPGAAVLRGLRQHGANIQKSCSLITGSLVRVHGRGDSRFPVRKYVAKRESARA